MDIRVVPCVCSAFTITGLDFIRKNDLARMLAEIEEDEDGWLNACKVVLAVTAMPTEAYQEDLDYAGETPPPEYRQEAGERWLESMGFTGRGPFENPEHDQPTQIRVWTCSFREFKDALENEVGGNNE